MIDQLKPLIAKLASFSQKRLGFKYPPKLFLRNDSQNSQQALGKTAFYNPQEQSVTLFIHGRHPKDILRSFAHELVHHCQNERGDLAPEKMKASGENYAQECPHMRKMEKEAYLKGNMCFRDWEDTIEDKDKFLIKLAESKFLKENKTMTTKITKEFLRNKIRDILSEENLGAADKVSPGGMSDSDYYKYAQRNTAAKTTARYKKIEKDMKNAAAKKKKPSAGEAFAQFAAETGALREEGEGELEVGPGLPDTVEPDLVVEPTLKQLIKQKQDEMMGTIEDAIAELKAELEAMEMQVNRPPEPEIKEGAGCAKRGCVDRKCPTHGPAIREAEQLEGKLGDGKTQGTDSVEAHLDKNSEFDGQDFAAEKGGKRGPGFKSKEKKEESKIQTPEQENTLYENRFTPKNNRLFEKLVKQWTK